jgi:hypothetical protein
MCRASRAASEAFDAEVAIGELIGDVTRHAGGFA